MPKRGGKGGRYDVGYGKPPAHTRFQKGMSGSPKGRSKGSKNLNSLLEAELSRQMQIIEGGRRHSITKREAAIKQLANKAIGGDLKALTLLFSQSRTAEAEDLATRTSPASTFGSDEADLAVIAALMERGGLAGGEDA